MTTNGKLVNKRKKYFDVCLLNGIQAIKGVGKTLVLKAKSINK